MKNIVFFFALLFITFSVNAQVDTMSFYNKKDTTYKACLPESKCCKEAKKPLFNKYVSFYGGFSDTKDVFGGFEAGLWGRELPLMLAVSVDHVRNSGTRTDFIGFKTYFEFYNKLNNYLFVYAAPKVTTDFDSYLIEYGVSYYYYVNDNFYPSATLGFQKSIPSFSIGVNFVR